MKLDELRKKLGLPEDADEAAVMSAIDGITEEVEPLRKVAHDFDKKAKFAAEYPKRLRGLDGLIRSPRSGGQLSLPVSSRRSVTQRGFRRLRETARAGPHGC